MRYQKFEYNIVQNIIKYKNLIIDFQNNTNSQNKSEICNNSVNLAINNQVHSNKVKIVTKENINKLEDADALVTTEKNINLAVYTADCLPIVFYDEAEERIAIAHAGWQGTVNQISTQVLKYFDCMKNIKIYIGPSAKSCCYIVNEPFLEKLNSSNLDKEAIKRCTEKRDALYFNLQLCNILQMYNCGIFKKNINLKYNMCTICNLLFCSYRRDKNSLKRQLTIVSLNG